MERDWITGALIVLGLGVAAIAFGLSLDWWQSPGPICGRASGCYGDMETIEKARDKGH